MKKIFVFALVALTMSSCSIFNRKKPISKPEITIEGRRLTPEALWAMGRIGDVALSPKGDKLAYTVSYYSVEENRSTTWIRVIDLNGKQLGRDRVGHSPAWTPDGKLAYIKNGKLYINRRPVLGVDNIEGFKFSPNGKRLLYVKTIKSHPTVADKYADLSKSSGRIVDNLMYKHWDEWVDKIPHPFLADFNGWRVSNTIDILADEPYECPMRPFSGMSDIAFTPDSKYIAYSCRKKTGMEYAFSTNSDIYLYNIDAHKTDNLTEGMMGYDTHPSFSSDGQFMAWLSMEHDGYESDQNRLFVMDMNTKEKFFLSDSFDSNVDDYVWKDNQTLLFTGVWHALSRLYSIDLNKNMKEITSRQYNYNIVAPIPEGFIVLRHSMREANEIYKMVLTDKDKELYYVTPLTHENKNIYDQIDKCEVQPRWQTTSDGKRMLTWVIYPPQFDPSRKYPTLLYCEGGPQSPVSQFWSFRWNFSIMAANDYIIVAPNRRGLPGFGKKWNEEISGDYAGLCMQDYFTAIDDICNEPYVDTEHLGCVGASFGGYSVYWLAGHHDGRFKAFIAHDGIFNMEMQYLETEEKWFADWDMGGAYWEKENITAQRTFANSPHHFVERWNTPILCIHGEKDYRILANQGMAAFDAAKLQGVPAELLIFPDENHWVLKPQNGILWQRTFFEWLNRWLKEDNSKE